MKPSKDIERLEAMNHRDLAGHALYLERQVERLQDEKAWEAALALIPIMASHYTVPQCFVHAVDNANQFVELFKNPKVKVEDD